MEILLIDETEDTPEVKFNKNNGLLQISGVSIPENAVTFYEPLKEWLHIYSKTPHPTTVLNVKLSVINTSSSKLLMDVFAILEELKQSNNDVHVNWFFQENDEDIHEMGIEYSENFELPFELLVED